MIQERHETAEEKDAAGGEDGGQDRWLRVAIPGQTVYRQNCGPMYEDYCRPLTPSTSSLPAADVGETVPHHKSTDQPLQGQLFSAGIEGRAFIIYHSGILTLLGCACLT